MAPVSAIVAARRTAPARRRSRPVDKAVEAVNLFGDGLARGGFDMCVTAGSGTGGVGAALGRLRAGRGAERS